MDLAKRAKLERRLNRRERSIGLWLTRLVALLSVFENAAVAHAVRDHIERFLDAATHCVVNFIARRATWSAGYQRRVARGRDVGCAAAWSGDAQMRASTRALLGGALRRALKAKSPKDRAEKLLHVLNNRDRWVAYMARRLERGQTRIYSAHSRVAKTLPPCRAEAQRAKAGLSQISFGEDLRVAFVPP